MGRPEINEQDFLSRMDHTCEGLFAIGCFLAALFLQPMISYPFTIITVMIFVLLLSGLIVPFAIDLYAQVSGSAYLRLISLVMLPASLLTTVSMLLWVRVWNVYLTRSVVEELFFSIAFADSAVFFFPTMYMSNRLYAFFHRNLRKEQLPSVKLFKRRVYMIIFFYWIIANLTIFFIFPQIS